MSTADHFNEMPLELSARISPPRCCTVALGRRKCALDTVIRRKDSRRFLFRGVKAAHVGGRGSRRVAAPQERRPPETKPERSQYSRYSNFGPPHGRSEERIAVNWPNSAGIDFTQQIADHLVRISHIVEPRVFPRNDGKTTLE